MLYILIFILEVELQPEEMGDEEIEWENEALQSPLAPENRAESISFVLTILSPI